ncbi:MAG TPA: DUF4148 domain-containing protein [Paraburkholderia sp.]|jgi:hypothetical protein
MMSLSIRKLAVLFASAALTMMSMALPVSAQNTSTDGSTSANATQPISPGAVAASSTKEQRKAARKEARAKKNAELKQLEDAGYQPSSHNNPHYPQDLQNAQKKAGIGQGASQ